MTMERVSFNFLSLYLVQIENTPGYKRDLCHLMKQNLFWMEEIVREFFLLIFVLTNQVRCYIWFGFSCQ